MIVAGPVGVAGREGVHVVGSTVPGELHGVMSVVMRDLDPVVDTGMERDLGEQVSPCRPERSGVEGAGFDSIPFSQDLLKSQDARVPDAHAGRVLSAGRVGSDLRLGLRDYLVLEAEIEEECGAVADDRTADREGQLLRGEVLRPVAELVLAGERLVLDIAGERSAPAIGAGTGHHVDQPRGKGPEAHVKRGRGDLQLPDRLDR